MPFLRAALWLGKSVETRRTLHSQPSTLNFLKLLDRYVLRNFFEPFFICFFGFISIWLIFDLSDNAQEFLSARASFKAIAFFYLTQLPATVLISLPVGLLLALLFSLSRMSRSNEIISMLTAGRSVMRVLLPLLFVGLGATGVCFALNYELAPHAEAIKKVALEQIGSGRRAGEIEPVKGHLFRDRMNHRTWYVRQFTPGSLQLERVHITQQEPDGRITKKWYAQRAVYDPKTRNWVLNRGMTVEFDENGDIATTDNFPDSYRNVPDWTETPWRVGSSRLDPQGLSIPDLREYLRYNADFPPAQLAPYRATLADRWAVPWTCLIVVFVAAPLGIVYSRRGVLAGVASSIFIFFGMIMMRYLFLALGKGGRLTPELALWIPNALFFAIGIVLLYFRATNRDLPKLSWKEKTRPLS